MKYLDHCLYSTAADPERQRVASAMQYLPSVGFCISVAFSVPHCWIHTATS